MDEALKNISRHSGTKAYTIFGSLPQMNPKPIIDNVACVIHSNSGEVIMPEAPDLEVIKGFLNRHVYGQRIESATVLRPTVLRSLAGDFPADIQGRTFGAFQRRGKFLLAEISGGRRLVVNPMLTGAFQYCGAKERVQKKTCFTLSWTGAASCGTWMTGKWGWSTTLAKIRWTRCPGCTSRAPTCWTARPLRSFKSG